MSDFKPPEAINASPYSESWLSHELDRRLLPTLEVKTEWKDQPRISTPIASRDASPARSKRYHSVSSASTSSTSSSSQGGSTSVSSNSSGSSTGGRKHSHSLSRFFHHSSGSSKNVASGMDNIDENSALQHSRTPRHSPSSSDDVEPHRRSSVESSTTDSGYGSSHPRRPSESSTFSNDSRSLSVLGSDDDDASTPCTPLRGGQVDSGSESPEVDVVVLEATAPVRFTPLPRSAVNNSHGQASYFDLQPHQSSSKRPSDQQAPPPSDFATPSASPADFPALRRTQSAEQIQSPSMADDGSRVLSSEHEQVTGLHSVWKNGNPVTAASFLPTPPPSKALRRTRTGSISGNLRRRNSMTELSNVPPTYDSVKASEFTARRGQGVIPRDDLGHEGLPPYSCQVHLEGWFPRKVEFTSPGVPSKDRSWKRQYVVIRGTSVKIYQFDLRTHPMEGEDDWSGVDVATVSGQGSGASTPLHFHPGEYNSLPSSSLLLPKSLPISVGDARARFNARHSAGSNKLVGEYSLQYAESGLAIDYWQKPHVVRLRAEGEQLLLQCKDERGVLDLVEALQAATAVSLDLDDRPLPTLITLPRRRRRRPLAATPAPTPAESSSQPTSPGLPTARDQSEQSWI
ncbi:hypothetical protein T439DRAFT_324840 [Meredithblackwellia eburnea MCA 4105]